LIITDKQCGTRLSLERARGGGEKEKEERYYCPRCKRSFRCEESNHRKKDRFSGNYHHHGLTAVDNHNKRRRSSSLSDDGPAASSRPYHPPRETNRQRPPQRPKFPVPFELEPEEYVLDPITGYFYENRRHFYHCPKSKLYYHIESKRYFNFDREEDAYMDVDFDYGTAKMKFDFGEKDTVLDSDDLVVQALQGTKKVNDTNSKNKISITIKQPLLSKKSSSKKKNSHKSSNKQEDVIVDRAKDAVDLVERRQKAHQDDIEKWTQRVKESIELERTPLSVDAPVDHVEEKVSRTKSGKPVCMLCRRKFINMEKLEQHQLHSQLHKFNLGKAARASAGKHKAYQDRAYNRRVLYESQALDPILDVTEVEQLMAPNLEEARKVLIMESVRPEDNLGDSNIGNKMLQKLGWDGGSLGRKGSSDGDRGSEALKNEWKRIEALAKH